MSSPRDRDGFDDRGDEARGWHEPAHLGEGGADPAPDTGSPGSPASPGTPNTPDAPDDGARWQPPGWDLPPAESRPEPAGSQAPPPALPDDRPAPPARPPWGGRPRRPGEVEKVFRYEGDAVGVQGWAVQHGWSISDGSGPQDAVLAELVASAPVRATRDHRPATVLRGRYGTLELVAFDVVYASGRYLVPEWAVTAAPLLVPPPTFRLSPARFWKHRTGGLLQIPSGDEVFDSRWVLLAAEDTPAVRRLSQDPEVHRLLLGSDDGDEFWSAVGHVAAIRPDGHRPSLVEHHARLLAAVAAALTAGSPHDQLG
jgi:hypothetical protein